MDIEQAKKVLSNETLQDEIAVSVARVLASANRKAKELGVDARTSLITVSQHLAKGVWLWRVLVRRERLRRAARRRFDD